MQADDWQIVELVETNDGLDPRRVHGLLHKSSERQWAHRTAVRRSDLSQWAGSGPEKEQFMRRGAAIAFSS